MDTDSYAVIKTSVKKLFNIDLNYYKDEQMKRRLDSWLLRTRMQTWNDYFGVLADNTIERDRFRDYLTINVTEFFRDPDRWKVLQNEVVPKLLQDFRSGSTSERGLKVWSAGCSIGVEAYSLAMLMDEAAPRRVNTILATDIDQGALQKARSRGPYSVEDTRNLSGPQRQKYLSPSSPYFVNEAVARTVTFRQQDMLADRFDSGFDLIVCRNVIIYFTNEAKAMLYSKFQEALRPGGVLFLGGTEIIPRPAEIGFRNFGISFYQKV